MKENKKNEVNMNVQELFEKYALEAETEVGKLKVITQENFTAAISDIITTDDCSVQATIESHSCSNCKYREWIGMAEIGNMCNKHGKEIDIMFPDENLRLTEIGCLQWEKE
jgi:hypothetical protein